MSSSRVVTKKRPLGTAPRQWPERPMRCSATAIARGELNVEDAIKVAGLEGKMSAIDLTELVDRRVTRESADSAR